MTPDWPDFYLVGAPKAGTTSLYQYLAGHPDVFLPARKELWLFGSDLEIRNRRRWSADDLPELYRDAPAGACRGLAYVWYLYSREAAADIAAVRPDGRILIVLRDPVAALHALHSEFVYDGNEDIADFGAALAAESDRCAGRRIPAEAHFPAGLCYRSSVRYAEQVERYLDRFGAEHVHVVLFDDLVADPERTGSQLLSFLGLSPQPQLRFPHANPNKRARSVSIRRLLADPPPQLRRVVRGLVPAAARRAAYRRAEDLNATMPARPSLPSDIGDRLRAELEPEVRRLEALLGRSLASWLPAP
jgi:hypothetical protein